MQLTASILGWFVVAGLLLSSANYCFKLISTRWISKLPKDASLRKNYQSFLSMKKIGFIDYYLDEWHANNYPLWLRETSAGQHTATYAYGAVDAPNGTSSVRWCELNDVTLLSSIAVYG